MRSNILVFVALLFLLGIQSNVYSQIKLGLKGGIHTVNLEDNPLTFNNIGDFVVDSKYGFQFGLFIDFDIGPLYLEPSIMFHSTKLEYQLNNSPVNDVFKATYKNVDIPVVVGFRTGLIRLFGGPVGHFHIDSTSDLFQFSEYDEQFNAATFGFQAGARIDISKFIFEVKYEGNLSKFGEFIRVAGQELNIDDRPARIIANVGFKF